MAVRIVLALVPLGAVLAILAALLPPAPDPSDPGHLAIRIGAGAVISGLTLTVIGLLRAAEGRGWAEVGLSRAGAGWRAAVGGALLWFVPAAAAFGVLAVLGAPLTVSVPAGEVAWTVLLLFVAVLLTEAVPEEVVFRGYLITVLGTRWGRWWAVVVQALVFTLFAGLLRQDGDPLALSLFLAMGIVFGYLRLVTGSVWAPVGFHAAFQTGAQLVLTHDVVTFAGGTGAAMLATGTIPFTVAAVLLTVTGSRRAHHAGS